MPETVWTFRAPGCVEKGDCLTAPCLAPRGSVCSRTELPARSAPRAAQGRAAASRAPEPSPLGPGRCAAAPRERSPPSARRSRGSGSRRPGCVGSVGWLRAGATAGLPAAAPAPFFHAPRVKFGGAPALWGGWGGGLALFAAGPGDPDEPGSGRAPWLCPRAVEGRRARAWRPRGPRVGPRGAERGRRASAPRRPCRNRAPGRAESRRAPRRGRLSAFPLLSPSFCSSESPPRGPRPAGRRGEAGRAGAGARPEPGEPRSCLPQPPRRTGQRRGHAPGERDRAGRGTEVGEQQHTRPAQPGARIRSASSPQPPRLPRPPSSPRRRH